MRLFRRGEDASTLDLLVAGLGNPGREYARTRHNVGWMVLDELARRHGGSWRSKFSGQLSEIRLDGGRLALVKPETYMNESGRSIAAAAKFFKTPVDAVLVAHDDVDLEEGRLQIRARRRPRRPQRPALDRVVARLPGLPADPDRSGAARPRRSPLGRGLRARPVRSRGRRRRPRRSCRRRRRVDRRARASTPPSIASTDRSEIGAFPSHPRDTRRARLPPPSQGGGRVPKRCGRPRLARSAT